MTRPRVLLIEPTIRPVGTEILQAGADVRLAPDGSEATLVAHIAAHRSQAMVVRVESATRRIFESCPTLQVVAMHGVGTDTIDVEAATEAGILVINAPWVNYRSTAEHALTLLLAVAKNVRAGDAAVRSGDFTAFRNRHLPMEVEGRTLLVVGLGRIGSEMARKCSAAFGMRVLGVDPAYGAGEMTERGAEKTSLADGLAEADFVSLHVPLKADTARMIGAAELAAMKPGAILVNASRGGVVDQRALAAALESGHLGGAGLDVFDPEPVAADDPVLQARGTVLSPHYAGDTATARDRCSETVARDLLALFAGGTPSGLVNPAVLSRPGLRLDGEIGRRLLREVP